jgi:hypothetical protein
LPRLSPGQAQRIHRVGISAQLCLL